MQEQPSPDDQDRSPEMARTEQTPAKCPECNGFGEITVHHYFTREEHTETCGSCGGTGYR
jgi:DnaJ-class molecular chaperone